MRCVERMNGRFFDGRTISAEFYDGFTNYEVKESGKWGRGGSHRSR